MHLVYCLNCTVCGKSYDGRSSWLKHLCQDEHQDNGRRKSVSCWWDGDGGGGKKGMRECTVVIFCSFSLSDPGVKASLLENLSRAVGDNEDGEHLNIFVTDFVWWPERDTVGYVQFESRKAVQQLFDGLVDSPNLQVNNKLVQLKKAVDICKLELMALLPAECNEQITTSNDATQSTHAFQNQSSSSEGTQSSTSLETQYKSIRNFIEIPAENFEYILKIVNLIKTKLQEIHPSGQVEIFRNYYLRLKNTGTNTLLLFAYIADNPSDPHSYVAVDTQIQDSIFNCDILQNSFPDGPFYRKHFAIRNDEGTQYQNPTSGFRLNFVTHPLTIVESQLCLLLQYLCTFDPHVKPLLTLVHFWALSNDVHLAEKNISMFDTQSNSPEPAALKWLVILFLSMEGLIPKVREILNNPHKPLVVTDRRRDVGFSEDPEFAKEWRKSKGLPAVEEVGEEMSTSQFIIEVVILAQKFFQFYSTKLEKGCWVLNPKDGEILKREGTHIEKSQLSKEETRLLAWVQASNSTKPHLLINDYRIFILHPLYIYWKLSFDVGTWTESTCQKMKETGKKLDEFLQKQCGQTLESILGNGGNSICTPTAYKSPPIPLSSQVDNPTTSLQTQLNSVYKVIEIPQEEFNYALETYSRVHQLFQKEYPTGHTVIYRNYYLRLRNTGTNTLLIYAFAENPFDRTNFITIPINFQLDLPGFRKKRNRGDIDGTTYYEHDVSKFRFHFVTFPLQIVEAHLSLLVQYLCTFDPRVKPVLSLIYFWARSHHIRIAEEEYPNFKYHSNCPEPVALEWLVILFLCRENVIPKVRQILERPHKPLLVSENRLDVGFSMDLEYPKEWRHESGLPVLEDMNVTSDQFILEVVDLAQKFFEFYGSNLEDGCWVLNPKDGEIIKRDGTHMGKSGLSKEDMERLAIVQCKENIHEHLVMTNFRIFMLHPLYITWKLSFDVERWTNVTCGKMKRMGEDLRKWLNWTKNKKGQQKGSLEEVLAGGAENSKEVQLELSCEMNQNLRAAIRTKLEQRKRESYKDNGTQPPVKKTKRNK